MCGADPDRTTKHGTHLAAWDAITPYLFDRSLHRRTFDEDPVREDDRHPTYNSEAVALIQRQAGKGRHQRESAEALGLRR